MLGVTYYELKGEMDEVFDGSIKQIAEAISVHNISDHQSFDFGTVKNNKLRHGEEEFLTQIWNGEMLIYTSHSLTLFPNQGAGGVKTVASEGEKWRHYGIKQGKWLIQVAQPISERHILIWEMYAELLAPMLILIPIMAGFIWFFVGAGLRPLERITALIEKRDSDFMDKLPQDGVPIEVSSLVKALNRLLDRLETALDKERQFTANAAHELRTPLTAVRLELDALKRSDTPKERKQSIETLFLAVDRCTRLVQQLLELARQEPNSKHEEMKSISLKPIAERVVDGVSSLAKSKSIKIKIDDFDDVAIKGQEYALETMLSNLIGNAVLYTPENGTVRILAVREGNVTILKIADNGRGIAKEEKDKVFDRFHRVLDTGVDGSGLGLSIVKAIADRHNAVISIEKGLDDRGCSFIVTFPDP